MLNIRQVIAVSITSLVIGSFSLAPVMAPKPKEEKEYKTKNVYTATIHRDDKNIEPQENEVVVSLSRNTVTTTRSQAREAIDSNYSDYFDVETLAFLIVYAEGWTVEQWECLSMLWHKESGFNPNAQNKKSTAYGVAQFLDSTWENYGFEKTSNPKEQIIAGISYIEQRYGSACNAWDFWSNRRWY